MKILIGAVLSLLALNVNAATIFATNSAGTISSYDALTHNSLGTFGSASSGLAYGNGVIYATSTAGTISSYDALTHNSLGGFGSASSGLAYMPSPVPIPAAVWLFGSGLIGLVGLARRKIYA